MNKKLRAQLDAKTVKFQTKIRKNLQLFYFSKDAIKEFAKNKKKNFSDYEFNGFKKLFKNISFKSDTEIKKVDYKKITDYGQNLVDGEFKDLIFVLNISTFETWMMESFSLIFFNEKKVLMRYVGENKIKLSEIHDSENMEEFWGKIINNYLIKKSYKGVSTVLEDLLSSLNIKEKSFKDLLGKINENCLCRNLIIHNNGVVNDEYIFKAGKYKKYKEGEKIKISDKYLFEQGDNLLFFMKKVRDEIKK